MKLFEPPFLNLEYFYQRSYDWLSRSGGNLSLPPRFVFWFEVISFSLTILFGLGLAYLIYRTYQLRQDERRELANIFSAAARAESGRNEAWQRTLQYLESDNPSDWKLAIIEADNILDQMVRAMQYAGENLGERLKNIEPSDFTTLEDAWEAHKVRNRIAHESGYLLTKREARRVIGLFENVFKEFDYI